jgi:hypothetical protein
MKRGLLFGFALLLVGCGDKTFESLCTAQVPPPAACATECSPSAANNCPGGFHCATDGKCDLFCTQAGNECGEGYSCTADGFCSKNGGGGSGSAEPDASCPALHFTPSRTTPTVELLLDESSSMSASYGGPTRLEAMRNALVDPTTGVVTKLANQVIFGVSLYTGTGSAPPTCPTLTRQARAINNLAPIRSLLNMATPKSNTPTAASIDAVVATFAADPPPASSPKIIVLATDGLPDTCADQNPPQQTDPTKPLDPRQLAANATSVEAAKRAFAAGIRLYFLFIGDATQARNHPQEMANAGAGLDVTTGRAPFFIATSPADLTNAFNTIVGGVVSCDLRLDSQLDPGDAPNGVVTINDQKLNYPADWTLDNDGITIHILGNACTMLKAATNPVVDAAFPCGTIIL